MTRATAVAACLSISAFVLAGFGAGPALAQEKKAAPKVTVKVLADNEKVRVQENTYVPGAENTGVPRDARVVRAITSGTLQRIYPDGKKETVNWKAGATQFFPAMTGTAPQYITKNVGKTKLMLYVVILK